LKCASRSGSLVQDNNLTLNVVSHYRLAGIRARRMMMETNAQSTRKIFVQHRAILDPVAIIAVANAFHIAYARMMNVSADHTVQTMA
jgi:uncharacterized SAM-binding protein YcdF (DUF218 family)